MIKICDTLLALAFVCGASLAPGQTRKQASSLTEDPASTGASRGSALHVPLFHERDARYRVQPQDVLSITFILSPELDQKTVIVEPDGYVSLHGTRGVHVQGLTVPEIVDTVKRAYLGVLHEPTVDVNLVDFQKPTFAVLGQVYKPGMYDLRRDITVTEALATAGGFNAGAKTQVLLLRRVSQEWAEVRNLNVKQMLDGKDVAEDVYVQPGDMIFVPEKAITKLRKYVPYGLSANPSSWAGPL